MVGEGGQWLVCREWRHVVQVLTSCIVQEISPEWKGRGCLERWLSATSVCLTLLSGKNMQSSGVHVCSVGVNTLVLVKQLVLFDSCARKGKDQLQMWVVKCSVSLTSCFS